MFVLELITSILNVKKIQEVHQFKLINYKK